MAQYAKGVARREEILRVALELFSSEGYRGTTLREVARRVGMSLPGLIHHFDSKEQLLIEVLSARDADNRRFSTDGDEIDLLIRVMGHNRTVPGLVELYLTMAAAAADSAHPARAFFSGRMPRVIEIIAQSIRQGQAAGDVPADLDAAHLARVLVALADGLQVQWLVDPSTDMAGDIARLWAIVLASRGA